nr:hypothetical protein [Thermus caldifontis]
MQRRTLLVKLFLLLKMALLASAWGEEAGKKEEEQKREGRKKKEEKGDGKKGEDRSAIRYYGQVEGVEDNTLWMGGRALWVQAPLLPYLAPGMVVEVAPEGITVLSPSSWAYYQGSGSPLGLGQGWVRIWWKEGGVPWRVLSGNRGQALLVARYQQGVWQAVPTGFTLPRPPQEGWWLLAMDGKVGRLIQRLE